MLSVTFDNWIFAAQRYGGVSRYFVELARHLSLTGELRVYIDAPWYVTDALETLRNEAVCVRGRRVPVFPGVTMLANRLAQFTTQRVSEGILHSTWYPRRSRSKGRAALVVTVHDMIAERFPEMVRGAARQSADKANAVQMADAVLCVSNHTKNDLMRYLGMTSERVFVTPLATSINLLSIGDRVNVATPFILYVGQRGGYKNFAALIDAFKRSTLLRTNFCLLCFGGGPFTAEERELLGGCAQSGAGSVMHQTGNDLALAAAYRAASAFVCPSMYEGFGLPLLEAMACGCPSIATPYGSLPEVGADCVAYSVDSSAEALQDVMEKVLFDNEALRVLSLSGMRRASAFSWEETARLTLSAYRKVAA